MVKKTCAIAAVLSLSVWLHLFALEEVSSRISSLGISFTGLVPDPYTDILRNPASLPGQDDPLLVFTVAPRNAYRAGIFLNPTPFLSSSRGGAVFTFERGVYYLPYATLKEKFPLEYFLPIDVAKSGSGNLPPTDLLKSGRNSYILSSSSDHVPLTSSFFYALAPVSSLSLGVNYLRASQAFDPEKSRSDISLQHNNFEDHSELRYSSSIIRSDSDEELESIRVGALWHPSEQYDVDFEVTASRSRGFSESFNMRSYHTMKIFPDSTVVDFVEDSYRDETDPYDKEVLEANLFLRRTLDRGFLSFRVSFLSGDASKGDLRLDTDQYGDTTVTSYRNEYSVYSNWTGGLVGIGGGRPFRDSSLDIFWGAFYGFMRSSRFQTREEERVYVVRSLEYSHYEDRWNTHLAQVNLAAEYDVTTALSLILGWRTTALFMKDRIKDWSYVEPDPGLNEPAVTTVDYSMIVSSEISAGAGFRLTDRLRFDVYTAELSELSSWRLDSLLSFSL